MNAVLSVDKVTALVLVCARPAKRGKRTVAEWAAVMGCESDHVRAACAELGVECDHADRPRLREASGIEVADHAARRVEDMLLALVVELDDMVAVTHPRCPARPRAEAMLRQIVPLISPTRLMTERIPQVYGEA